MPGRLSHPRQPIAKSYDDAQQYSSVLPEARSFVEGYEKAGAEETLSYERGGPGPGSSPRVGPRFAGCLN